MIKGKELLKALKLSLAFIENTEHYYSMFLHVIEQCFISKYINNVLHLGGSISDEEHYKNESRISKAMELAIVTHGECTIRMFEQSKTQHTPRTFVSSVYSDIFGIELKEEDKK